MKRPFLKIRKGSLVVSVGQGIGHTSHHLLKASLQLRGEFTAKAASQHNHQHVAQELFLRIHVQLITVQLTQRSKGTLEVIKLLQALTEGVQHLLAMGLHLRVSQNGIGRGQVPKGLKEPLSPGVDNQQPRGRKQHKVRGSQQLSESQGRLCPHTPRCISLSLNLSCRRRQWHPTPVLLPGKSHGRRSLEGCSPWGRCSPWGHD
uniref:Uncharacterized protein n=1 Tax=Bos indicus x Bos taurus TaxID=30522 RepID=A0A4W2IAY0_BOBOX